MKHKRLCIFVVFTILFLLLTSACTPSSSLIQEIDVGDDSGWVHNIAEDDAQTDDTPTAPTAAPETVTPVPDLQTNQPINQPTEQPDPALPIEPGVTQINANQTVSVNTGGVKTDIQITDQDDTIYLQTRTNSASHSLMVDYGYFLSAQFVTVTEGYSFLLLSYDEASDDYTTCIYIFEGASKEPVFACSVNGYVTNISDAYFSIYGYIYAIGTWPAEKLYLVNEDGITEDVYGLYYIDQDAAGWPDITVSKTLPVYLMEEGMYQPYSLNPGAPITFTATDTSGYMAFELWDGTEGYFNFTVDESYIEWINGVEAIEYFNDLPFYG